MCQRPNEEKEEYGCLIMFPHFPLGGSIYEFTQQNFLTDLSWVKQLNSLFLKTFVIFLPLVGVKVLY